MSDELPELPATAEGWSIATVRSLVTTLQYGISTKADANGKTGVPILRMGNIQDGRLDLSNLKYVPRSKKLSAVRLARGDILFNRTNSPDLVGKSAVVDVEDEMVFASYLIRLVTRADAADAKYLCWWINSAWGREWAARVKTDGVSQSNINGTKLGKMRVPVAPFAEQHRIVEKVETLLEQVNRAKRRLERVTLILKRFRQAVLAAAFSGELTREWRETRPISVRRRNLTGLLARRKMLWEKRNPAGGRARRYPGPFEPGAPEVEVPEDWSWVSVSHLALLDVGFAFKSAEFEDSGIRLLRGENVEPGSLRWLETRCWPKSKLDEFRHLLVEPGEIILAMDRPIVSAGLKIARVKASDVPALLVQRVMRFKMVDVADTDYLYWCLSHHRFVDFLAHDGMTGSDLPHITGTGVAEFPIPLPPPEEQVEIVATIKRLFVLADAIHRRVEAGRSRAEKIPQAILSKAFSGELVPTEADLARAEGRSYETADELLARLNASSPTAPSHRKKRSRGK